MGRPNSENTQRDLPWLIAWEPRGHLGPTHQFWHLGSQPISQILPKTSCPSWEGLELHLFPVRVASPPFPALYYSG